jgi:PAS domain S-box-containing protein
VSALADLLDARREELVRRWVGLIAQGLAPGPRSEPELRDHIADYLAEMARVLRAGAEEAKAARMGRSSIAQEHGAQRFKVGFDVDAVVREYDVLRECIFDLVVESGTPVPLAQVRLFTGFLATGVAEAVAEFSRWREAQLREAEAGRVRQAAEERALLTAVLEQMPVAAIVADASGRMLIGNSAIRELVGYAFRAAGAVEEYSASYHGFHLDGRAYRDEEWPLARALQTGQAVPPEELDIERSDGTRRRILLSAGPVRGADGRLLAAVTIAQDVTEARRLERERQRAVEVLEHGDAVFVVDRDWRVLLVNAQQERLTRTRREETLGRVLWEAFPGIADPASRFHREYHRAMREGVPVRFEDYYAPVGIWTAVSVYPTAEGGIAGFFRDVTERKRAEEALRRTSEFEQQLIGIVSHDLRNPLNAVLLSSKVLLRREGLDAHGMRTVHRIQESAERAVRLIHDLLDFTRGRLGSGIPIRRAPMQLMNLARSVADEMEAAYPPRQVVVRGLGDFAGAWDEQRLAQVLGNLVKNALEYSPEEAPVEVSLADEGPRVRLEVRNRGEPIRPEVLPLLFEPFQRGDAASARPGGLGLGLYIVRQLVLAHAGTIDVRSSREEGTVFSLVLPRDTPARGAGGGAGEAGR